MNHKKNTKKYNRSKYTGIYSSWYAMKQRCDNPNNKSYKNYGGRGITYPIAWKKFANFAQDMGNDYGTGLTLERIHVNESYSKQNCKWATRKEQCNNMRKTVFLEYRGQRKSISNWAKELGLSRGTFRSRYYRGMTLVELFNKNLFRPAKL